MLVPVGTVFNWLSKNHSDQSQQRTTQWTNQTFQRLSITYSKCGKNLAFKVRFSFASHWSLKNWRESFKPITKRSNRNLTIAFDSLLKTALLEHRMYVVNLLTFLPFYFILFLQQLILSAKTTILTSVHGWLPRNHLSVRGLWNVSLKYSDLIKEVL